MPFAFGKVLQLAGIGWVAFAFILGVTMDGALTEELLHLGIGFLVFSIGTGLVRRGSR